MSNKLTELEARFADLSQERAELDTAIEEMIGDMAEVAPEKRSAADWSPDGALTRKYLELTKRQAAVEAEFLTVSRAINAAKATLRH